MKMRRRKHVYFKRFNYRYMLTDPMPGIHPATYDFNLRLPGYGHHYDYF